MMLTTTLRAEVEKVDAEIRQLTRKRFSALARCDAGAAKRFYDEIQQLKDRRAELTDAGKLNF